MVFCNDKTRFLLLTFSIVGMLLEESGRSTQTQGTIGDYS